MKHAVRGVRVVARAAVERALACPEPAEGPGHWVRPLEGEVPQARRGCRGFTLLELLVVISIVALATAGVSLAMRDSSQTQLEREAQRLAALLESARAQSRASGRAVRWHPTAEGFQFDGLPRDALPSRWIGDGVAVSGPAGNTVLRLGPEPLIGRQQVALTLTQQPERRLWIATDGLRPFAVQALEP